MREIKFRGKRVDNGGWVYGYLVKGERTYILSKENIYNMVVSLSYFGSVKFIEVISETVGEYTGLKDKNGREIYEGDVVNGICDIIFQGKINEGTFFIAWDSREGRWELTSQEEKRMWNDRMRIPHFVISEAWTLEIIGNIYENPELIKDK